MATETQENENHKLTALSESIVDNIDVSDGTNLKILMNASAWFSKHGETITSYQFITSSASKVPEEAKETSCVICGSPLIKTTNDGSRFNRMFIFRSAGGSYFPTCYKMNSCFKRVGFESKELKINSEGEYVFDQIKPVEHEFDIPTYAEFLGLDEDADLDSVGFKLAEKNFNKVVRPFILKWKHAEITKGNINEFLKDFKSLSEHTSVFYEDINAEKVALNKIQKLINIKV